MLRAGRDVGRGFRVLIHPSFAPLGRAGAPATLDSLGIFSYLLFLAALDLNHHNDPKLWV